MAVHEHVLPNIKWEPTNNKGNRNGAVVSHVVLHTWGVAYKDETAEAASYHGVINYFKQASSQASAHFVYPGSAVENEITQMVDYAHYAWTEAAYNPTSVEIECADAIWLGHDPAGFEQLAHIVGFLLHHYRLPAVWSHSRGFCRHGDLGMAGGGHLACPTTNMNRWKQFASRVEWNFNKGGYRKTWGR